MPYLEQNTTLPNAAKSLLDEIKNFNVLTSYQKIDYIIHCIENDIIRLKQELTRLAQEREKLTRPMIVSVSVTLHSLMEALTNAAEKSPENVWKITGFINNIIQKLNSDELATVLSAEVGTSDFKGMNALYQLILALNLTSKKSPNYIFEITGLINSVFEKLEGYPEKLAGFLSEKIAENHLAGQNVLHLLMIPLDYAVRNSPDDISIITNVINKIIAKLSDEKLTTLLNAQRSFNGDNVFSELMQTLNLTAEKSPQYIFKITELINSIIEKVKPEQVGNLLSSKEVFHPLLEALTFAIKKNSHNNILKITSVINSFIEKLKPQELAIVFSTKKFGYDNFRGNALYVLMNALVCATEKSPKNISQITEVINNVTQKLNSQELATTLSAKIEDGVFAGQNALYLLMDTLLKTKGAHSPELVSVFFDLLAKISPQDIKDDNTRKMIFSHKQGLKKALYTYLETTDKTTLEKKCNPNTMLGALIDHHQVFFGIGKTFARRSVSQHISAPRQSYTEADEEATPTAPNQEKESSLSLAKQLIKAVRDEQFNQISDIVNRIEQLANETKADFITSMLEKIKEGDYTNANPFYLLVKALVLASKKSSESLSKISGLINNIIQKLSPQELAIVLSAHAKHPSIKGMNALYVFMSTLTSAAEKSPENILEITGMINNIIQKLDFQELAIALSEKITTGFLKDMSALYVLMNALACVAEKSPENISQITGVINNIIQKLNAQQLIPALSAKITDGIFAGQNAFFLLMHALLKTKDKNSPLFTVFFDLLAQISPQDIKDDSTRKMIFSNKNELKEALNAYLAATDQSTLKTKCNPNTMLGALIDHQRGFPTIQTETRKNVNERIFNLHPPVVGVVLTNPNPAQGVVVEQEYPQISQQNKPQQKKAATTTFTQQLPEPVKEKQVQKFADNPIKIKSTEEKIKEFLSVHKNSYPTQYNDFFELLAMSQSKDIDNKTQKMIFSHKKELKEALNTYLASNQNTLETKCNPNTMLGALIDHQTGVIRLKMTDTRKEVNRLIDAACKVKPEAKATALLPEPKQKQAEVKANPEVPTQTTGGASPSPLSQTGFFGKPQQALLCSNEAALRRKHIILLARQEYPQEALKHTSSNEEAEIKEWGEFLRKTKTQEQIDAFFKRVQAAVAVEKQLKDAIVPSEALPTSSVTALPAVTALPTSAVTAVTTRTQEMQLN